MSSLTNNLRGYEANVAVDDKDLAFVLYCDIPGTRTANLDTAVGDKLRLIDALNGTVDIDLTNTGLGLNYWAGLMDAIEALPKDAAGRGWWVMPHAIRRDDLVYATNTKILAKATTDAGGVPGIEFYWDTSRVTFRRGCVGMGVFSKMANLVDDLPALSRQQRGIDLGRKNVDSGKSIATPVPNRTMTPKLAARLQSISGVASYGSGNATFRMSKCRHNADGAVTVLDAAGATTVRKTLAADFFGEDGIISNAEERIIYELFNDATALTSSQLGAVGAILGQS